MITSRGVFLLVLCFFISACVESEYPLSPPQPLPKGHPLIGTWVQHNESETVYLHVGNVGQDVKVLEVEVDRNGMLRSQSYLAAVTVLGENHYLSVQKQRDPRHAHILLKYEISADNTLSLWNADPRFLSAAIKDGRIAGSAQSGLPNVRLSADAASLQAFVTANHQQIFIAPAVTLWRIAPTPARSVVPTSQ